MAEKSRPPFVKHLIIIMILFGIVFIGLNALAVIGTIESYGLDPSLKLIIPILYFALLTAIFICAYGLWTMKPWARKATIGTLIAVVLSGPLIFSIAVFYRGIRNLLKRETKEAYGG